MLLYWPNHSLLGAYVTLDLNIWHARFLTQAKGSTEPFRVSRNYDGYRLSVKQLAPVQQRATRMIERLERPLKYARGCACVLGCRYFLLGAPRY